MSRPSEGMTFDELRDEFDWMFEFQSRMAERIRDDADVHNLADYVTKLETENAKLRELVRILAYCMSEDRDCDKCVLNGANMPMPRISACDSLLDRMRELEVEVDG